MSVTKSSTLNTFFENSENARKTRNIAIIAHVDHGKSTLTDNLLAQAGLMNKELAGVSLVTDYDPEEKQRGITINTSAVSLFYKDHLINLLDTPGHVDFTSEVSKSLRAIDGAFLVMDVVEGVMVQTESVIGHAIKEGVKLILFMNKIDRMISELYSQPLEIYKKIQSNINNVNNLIKRLTDTDIDYFQLNKNVVFGSALRKWAFTVNELSRNNHKFSDFFEFLKNKQQIPEAYNLATVLLDLCIKEIPNPLETHKSRLRKLYEQSKKLNEFENLPEDFLNTPENSKFRGIITDANYDHNMNMLYTLRILSGVYNRGKKLYCSDNNYSAPIKTPNKVMIAMINKYQTIESAFAGAIVILQGTEIQGVGATVLEDPDEKIYLPQITYTREPIVSVSIAPKNLSETNKMIEGIKILCKEDPSLNFIYSEENKEFLLYGVGMLHLEVTLNKLKAAHNVDVKVSEPQVSYNQTLDSYARSAEVSVRSPNKHNDFRFQIFKLPDNVIKRLLKNQISAKTLNTELEKEGFPRALANAAVKSLDYGCIYFEQTHGADFMEECKNLIAKSITLALDKGILMKKPLKGIGFVITYAKIHEDPLHRTITQLRSAFREGLQKILKELNPSVINEPIMKLCVRVPSIYLENVSGTISNKRGYLLETESDSLSGYLNLTYEIPLAETFDISPKLMSTSEGRATFTMEFERFEKVSPQVLDKLKKRNLVQNLE